MNLSLPTAPHTPAARAERPIITSVPLALSAVLATASPAGAHPRPSPDPGAGHTINLHRGASAAADMWITVAGATVRPVVTACRR